MFYHKSHSPYPGELADLDYQVISLRTQLRLSYETYRRVRYLTWAGLLLLAVLLLLLPGGFPPRVTVLFWRALPVFGLLLKLHGAAALFALLALGLQMLTWLVLWVVLLTTCYKLGRYTWYLHRARVILASGWLSAAPMPMSPDSPPAPVVPEQPRPVRTSPAASAPFKRTISLPSISPLPPQVGTVSGEFSLDGFLDTAYSAPAAEQAQMGMVKTWCPSRPNWTSGETKSSTTKGRS